MDVPPEELEADLFVIGPEAPLVEGLADRLRAAGRLVFGPGADGARLEGSKAWMKDLLVEAGVPTARHGSFTEREAALEFLDTMAPPFVVKTDGLAAGKGVVVTESLTEARNAVEDYLSGVAFGDAGLRLVIEEGLVGRELSVLAVCDGNTAVLLPEAQDFKRARDGDEGPNTGGMGAYSPVPAVTADLMEVVRTEFVLPTLAALARGASTTAESSMRVSCSPPMVRGSWSTTCASATLRPRWCFPGSPVTWRRCWQERRPAASTPR
ncbi:MAG: hypothetical protein M5U19_02785 [Microthrixaceae bacterium]|nr:hypothetical protein [Microthrixaceae bacterium]